MRCEAFRGRGSFFKWGSIGKYLLATPVGEVTLGFVLTGFSPTVTCQWSSTSRSLSKRQVHDEEDSHLSPSLALTYAITLLPYLYQAQRLPSMTLPPLPLFFRSPSLSELDNLPHRCCLDLMRLRLRVPPPGQPAGHLLAAITSTVLLILPVTRLNR